MTNEHLPQAVQRVLEDIRNWFAFAKMRGTEDSRVLHSLFIDATETQALAALKDLVAVLHETPAFTEATVVVADLAASSGDQAAALSRAVDRSLGGLLYVPNASRFFCLAGSNAAEISLRTRMEEYRGRFVVVLGDSAGGAATLRQSCPGLLARIPLIWNFAE